MRSKQDEELQLEVIRGGAAPTLTNVQLGTGQYDHEIVISATKENPFYILC